VKSYLIKRWNGHFETILAARVNFKPAHVVFYGPDDRIVKALKNDQVVEIREDQQQ